MHSPVGDVLLLKLFFGEYLPLPLALLLPSLMVTGAKLFPLI